MEKINYSIYILCFIILIKASISEYNFYYDLKDVINFINQEPLDKEVLKKILENIKGIFNDAYAFNEIAINPTQPSFNSSYHNKVNLIEQFNNLTVRVDKGEISQNYEFYREIMKIISKLKDSHIQINWNFLNLDKFFIVSPVYFEMRYDDDINGEPKIFLKCSDIYKTDFVCSEEDYEYNFITFINGIDPFDFINNFGGDFVSTKNLHGTFSFKLDYHNEVPLSDYPLDEKDLGDLYIEFNSGPSITTQYYIASDTIEIEDATIFRNLNHKIKDTSLKTDKNNNTKRVNEKKYSRFKNIHNKNKKRRRLNDIYWNLGMPGNDIELNCYSDDEKKINIFYITSFLPKDKDAFIETIEKCYFNYFDKNKYPILVISHLNEGGFVHLSQLFLGIISPLISINMYKGRIRLTEAFEKTDDIIYYIETNLTNSNNCLHTNYEQLTNNKVTVEYEDNISQDLSEMFFLNNITIHNRIENLRKKMNYKRKPTEILIFTDGYSFSAASLFMQYLQKGGGAIIASYLGNPKYMHSKNTSFDISQSPSPIFNHDLLKIFSPNHYRELLRANENYKNDEDEDEYEDIPKDEWEIQMPGIQSFYGPDDYQTPLEYEVVQEDEKSDIFINFDGDSYNKFIIKAKKIFEKYETECNPNNTKLLKISDECDSKFPNDYTHGGYECGEDGKWTNKCVASYCDPGYFFHIEKKKCVKDVCSSISVTIIEDNSYKRPNMRFLSIFTLIFYALLIL
jgi:hypothetical protein